MTKNTKKILIISAIIAVIYTLTVFWFCKKQAQGCECKCSTESKDYTGFKKGDRVYDIVKGWGKVIEETNKNMSNYDYFIYVKFSNYLTPFLYTKDGKYYASDIFPSLYKEEMKIVKASAFIYELIGMVDVGTSTPQPKDEFGTLITKDGKSYYFPNPESGD